MKFVKKFFKGHFTILGKSIPAFLITALLSIGTVAALLTVYITITGSASVVQSVILNDFESSWKYEAIVDWGDTWATWSVPTMAGGDEQDVGFLISSYAEIPADIELVASTTGPVDIDYEECVDVVVSFWDDYTPHDSDLCTGLIEVDCLAADRCIWDGDNCWGDEKCIGSEISSSCTSDVSTTSAIVSARPDITDPTTPEEDWFCVRYAFDVAAVPGDYDFDLEIKPII